LCFPGPAGGRGLARIPACNAIDADEALRVPDGFKVELDMAKRTTPPERNVTLAAEA
jgi:hypothetical protein